MLEEIAVNQLAFAHLRGESQRPAVCDLQGE
jgi:hypothetical protein